MIGRERGERMLEALKEKFAAMRMLAILEDASTLLGPLVSERALQGLLKQIEEAKAAGKHCFWWQQSRPSGFLS